MGKLSLYWNTVRSMKPGQVYYRIRKMAGLSCPLGVKVKPYRYGDSVTPIAAAEDLDFDPTFLSRSSVEDLLQNRVTFLYETEKMTWDKSWNFAQRSPLWNFNLHYFEYLFPLTREFLCAGNRECYNKICQSISGWIHSNPSEQGGSAWAAYTIALRLTNWLTVYTWLQEEIHGDPQFEERLLLSIHEQYQYLSLHLEKDLLGNHYFEDLKALVLSALFFEDDAVLKRSLDLLLEQCAEQILPDGMHFELSPMYHKIILEDVIRTAAALRSAEKPCEKLESYIQPMMDVAFSMEDGLERLPLFNDGGSNVSKSLEALGKSAEHLFHVHPVKKYRFPDAGYYIFEQGNMRLIVDAGKPGPDYLPGHAHCDCMSFELFQSGRPVLVNCGTYAYQCEERSFFRSTAAHNTVQVSGTEQSQCWGVFRMGRRSKCTVCSLEKNAIEIKTVDYVHHTIRRKIILDTDRLIIEDQAENQNLTSYLHMAQPVLVQSNGKENKSLQPYAEEYGKKQTVDMLEIVNDQMTHMEISWTE